MIENTTVNYQKLIGSPVSVTENNLLNELLPEKIILYSDYDLNPASECEARIYQSESLIILNSSMSIDGELETIVEFKDLIGIDTNFDEIENLTLINIYTTDYKHGMCSVDKTMLSVKGYKFYCKENHEV